VLLDAFTVRQNLALPFTLDVDAIPDEVRARTDQLAAAARLGPDLLDQPTGGLAPGVRMRIHLARAIATGPDVLLLEHPTAAIPREDVPEFGQALADVVAARGFTMVAITEDVAFAERVGTTHAAGDGSAGDRARVGALDLARIIHERSRVRSSRDDGLSIISITAARKKHDAGISIAQINPMPPQECQSPQKQQGGGGREPLLA
jgi:ABC-type lipoprotein export system ATPase subunit